MNRVALSSLPAQRSPSGLGSLQRSAEPTCFPKTPLSSCCQDLHYLLGESRRQQLSPRLPRASQEQSSFLAFLPLPLVADFCGCAGIQTYLCAPQRHTSVHSVKIYSLQSLYLPPHLWSQYQNSPKMGLLHLNLLGIGKVMIHFCNEKNRKNMSWLFRQPNQQFKRQTRKTLQQNAMCNLRLDPGT